MKNAVSDGLVGKAALRLCRYPEYVALPRGHHSQLASTAGSGAVPLHSHDILLLATAVYLRIAASQGRKTGANSPCYSCSAIFDSSTYSDSMIYLMA